MARPRGCAAEGKRERAGIGRLLGGCGREQQTRAWKTKDAPGDVSLETMSKRRIPKRKLVSAMFKVKRKDRC